MGGGDHPALQVKLLRALQEREVTHVGGQRPIPVDVRVVAATHQTLEERIREGSFREDLYYRLKGVDIELPALRHRRQDVPYLVRLFIEEFCRREGLEAPSLGPEALSLLLAYDFPGNVRELQNMVEGAVSLADVRIDAELLRSMIGEANEDAPDDLDLAAAEKRHIERVLRTTDGNKSAAAKLLGIDRRTLQRKGF
ncbi:MAG: sigma 54-interacting transcriptional regulator [Acidobacteriota bacterium]